MDYFVLIPHLKTTDSSSRILTSMAVSKMFAPENVIEVRYKIKY